MPRTPTVGDTESRGATTSQQIRIPKVADVVAERLRTMIVTGEYEPGDLLPTEGALMGTFDVARTTIRDAFRILESEGLLEVRRGAGGGGRVKAPGVSFVASYAALLLQWEGTTLQDVHVGRIMLEAPAAGMLAQRSDDPAIVAGLERALNQESEAEDDLALTLAEGFFHRQVVDLTGNRVLTMLSGVANRLIAQQVARLPKDAPSRRTARTGFEDAHRAHVRLVDLVREGRAEEAELQWRRHLEASNANLANSSRAARMVIDLLP
jgi:DNA-binding FadR family transcriptional regulator